MVSSGETGWLFTGVNYNLYQPPPGFCFDVLCDDLPIIDNKKSKEYNVDQRVFNDLIRKKEFPWNILRDWNVARWPTFSVTVNAKRMPTLPTTFYWQWEAISRIRTQICGSKTWINSSSKSVYKFSRYVSRVLYLRHHLKQDTQTSAK